MNDCISISPRVASEQCVFSWCVGARSLSLKLEKSLQPFDSPRRGLLPHNLLPCPSGPLTDGPVLPATKRWNLALHPAQEGIVGGGDGANKVEMIAQALLSDWHGFESQLCYSMLSWVVLGQLLTCSEPHL